MPGNDSQNQAPPAHYYGDIVRICFVTGALLMLVTLPFFVSRLQLPLFGSIVFIIVLILFAGATTPKQLWTVLLDWIISLTAVIIFEYYAVATYIGNSLFDWFVWVNQLLAIIFFIALYFATKTLRAFLI